MPIQFALVGATGVGKTDLSLSLAEKCKAEIEWYFCTNDADVFLEQL